MRLSRFAGRLAGGSFLFCVCATASAAAATMEEMAAKFGARESVSNLTMSPDGNSVAYVTPRAGQGGALVVQSLADNVSKPVIAVSGDPERLRTCQWISNTRLFCTVYGVVRNAALNEILSGSRLLSVGIDGGKPFVIEQRQGYYARGFNIIGARLVDRLAENDGYVLLQRYKNADDRTGSRIGSSKSGNGVEQVNTLNGTAKTIEAPNPDAVDYISDGRGNIRIRGLMQRDTNANLTGVTRYQFRRKGQSNWEVLGDYNKLNGEGFMPVGMDPETEMAYGFGKKSGFVVVDRKALDGSGRTETVFEAPGVDVASITTTDAGGGILGAIYATDKTHRVYFDPELQKVQKSLEKALPGKQIDIPGMSDDGAKLLIWAGADNDPGAYYILDRKTKQMQTFLVSRSQLEGVELATVKPVNFPAADGTMIPGYLTLPPHGRSKNLPAIVLPHGGPFERDEWRFDWLSQFYANQGYAVLQPNFRGSAGYGEDWFQSNGYQSWKISIGDVLDGGRWLVKEGIADPKKLAVVGWSYGGYAALQSAVTDPGLFKAVIAIAPVTDLDLARKEWDEWTNRKIVRDVIGSGPHIAEASPARHADRITVPVLMFHGGMDRNVGIRQSEVMRDALLRNNGQVKLVTWDKLDHYLEDSSARTKLLAESAQFLTAVLDK